MSQPTYVIASTPRSGSSLLAGGLVATRVTGRPEEYFTPDHIASYKEDLKPADELLMGRISGEGHGVRGDGERRSRCQNSLAACRLACASSGF